MSELWVFNVCTDLLFMMSVFVHRAVVGFVIREDSNSAGLMKNNTWSNHSVVIVFPQLDCHLTHPVFISLRPPCGCLVKKSIFTGTTGLITHFSVPCSTTVLSFILINYKPGTSRVVFPSFSNCARVLFRPRTTL